MSSVTILVVSVMLSCTNSLANCVELCVTYVFESDKRSLSHLLKTFAASQFPPLRMSPMAHSHSPTWAQVASKPPTQH